MRTRRITWLAPAALFLAAACSGDEPRSGAEAQEAAVNPCAANPCANPCATQELPMSKIVQGGRQLDTHEMSGAELAAKGAELWQDPSLSGGGTTSCSTCHSDEGTAMMNASFAEPYPHPVAMAKDRAGLDQVTAAEMVQLCMAIPMNAEPLDYGSLELAALTAYVKNVQASYRPPAAGRMNPCDAVNPCDAANPCDAVNPCAANPCGG